MKKCLFCAEEIQDDAIKCKHCGEFLEKKPEVKWYFRTSILVVALLTVGPLALPLVWFHPQYSRTKKVVITAVILVLTYFLTRVFISATNTLNEYYQLLI